MVIINHGLQTMTNEVIIPHSGWEHEPNEDSKPRDAEWTTVFKNTSGCLRYGSQKNGSHIALCFEMMKIVELLKNQGFYKETERSGGQIVGCSFEQSVFRKSVKLLGKDVTKIRH